MDDSGLVVDPARMGKDPLDSQWTGLRCVIADDNESILVALEETLREVGIDVVAKARSGAELLALLEEQTADVLLLDLRLGDDDSIHLARSAAGIAPDLAVIVYTTHARPGAVSAALDAGARAVVLKQASPVRLLLALDEVMAGRTYIDPDLRRRGCS
jgi:DNA-binding NarL/FixJ family response regulator